VSPKKDEPEPPANPCAAHPTVEAHRPCPACAKACCVACLVVHGPEKALLCSKCMAALADKLKKSASQHELLMTALLVLTIAGILWGLSRKFDAVGIAAAAGGAASGVGTLVTWLRQKRVEARLKVELYKPS